MVHVVLNNDVLYTGLYKISQAFWHQCLPLQPCCWPGTIFASKIKYIYIYSFVSVVTLMTCQSLQAASKGILVLIQMLYRSFLLRFEHHRFTTKSMEGVHNRSCIQVVITNSIRLKIQQYTRSWCHSTQRWHDSIWTSRDVRKLNASANSG